MSSDYRYWLIYTDMVFAWLAIAVISILLCYHSSKMYKDYIANRSTDDISSEKMPVEKWITMVKVATFLVLILFLINSVFNAVRTLGDSLNEIQCRWMTKMAYFTYAMAKQTMYFIFIARLIVAFTDSVYQYSNSVIVPLYTVNLLLVLAYIGTIFPLVSGYIDYEYTPKAPFCISSVALWATLPQIIIDVVYSIICLGLFVRPLFLISHQSDRNDELLFVASRYTVLTMMAVLSSLISLILLLSLDWGWQTAIDNVINCICVQLMGNVYQMEYGCCCHRLEHCCFHRFLLGQMELATTGTMRVTRESGLSSGSIKLPWGGSSRTTD